MKKYMIVVKFETEEDIPQKQLDEECELLSNEFLESEIYNIGKINVYGRRVLGESSPQNKKVKQ